MAIDNKLEFKVITGKSGRPLRLDDMSVEEAKAFLVLYESLVNLVELTDSNSGAHISITQSSLATSVQGPIVQQMKEDFDSVIHSTCTNRVVVEQWRNIQGLFKANGLGYDASYYNEGVKESIVSAIKDSRKFLTKTTRKKYQSAIKFVEGQLIEVGGKKPNIHIDYNGSKLKVTCTEETAKKANPYLYSKIRISAWVREVAGFPDTLQLCDVYDDATTYADFGEFFYELKEMEELDALSEIHDKVQGYLESGDFDMLRKICRVWIHHSTDIPTLKTILVITKEFKAHHEFENWRLKLLTLYDKKMEKHMKRIRKKANAHSALN